MGYPRHQRARDFKVATKSGNVTVNSTSYVDLDNALDLVIPARVDDYIEIHMCGRWANEAVLGYLDVVTVVGGSPVNYCSGNGSSGEGIPCWRGYSGRNSNLAGGTLYKVVSGDISGGTVTLRLRAKTGTAANKVFVGNQARWWAENIGPAAT